MKHGTQEEREEALKLANEIGVVATAKRLGIKENTLYGWQGKAKKQVIMLNEQGELMSLEEVKAENAKLRKEPHQAEQDVEILEEALSFFVKSRRK
jgi:transposase